MFEGDGLQLGFDQVTADSRCPRGVQCIVAGEATVRFWLAKPSGARDTREVKTTASGSEVVYDAYRIKLVTLDPYPASGTTIRPSDYVAAWLVTRAP